MRPRACLPQAVLLCDTWFEEGQELTMRSGTRIAEGCEETEGNAEKMSPRSSFGEVVSSRAHGTDPGARMLSGRTLLASGRAGATRAACSEAGERRVVIKICSSTLQNHYRVEHNHEPKIKKSQKPVEMLIARKTVVVIVLDAR